MFTNGIEQARKQKFAGGVRARQETSYQMARASAFPLLAGKARRIDEGTIRLVTVQKTFFEEPVERSHYCGVGERTTELGDNVAHARLSMGPENFH